MAKIAVTCEGPTLDDMVDPRFGRAGGFLIVDTETMETSYVDNGGSQSLAQGAGPQAAENVVNAGATVVVTGMVGPKAMQALTRVGIKVAQGLEGMTAGQAVERFKAGDFTYAEDPAGGPGK